jgi:hypothetical protein
VLWRVKGKYRQIQPITKAGEVISGDQMESTCPSLISQLKGHTHPTMLLTHNRVCRPSHKVHIYAKSDILRFQFSYKVVHGSTILTTILYVTVGMGGALAIPSVNPNLLAPLVSGAFGTPLRIGASFFAFVIIGLDIPLFSVLTRYNLVNSGLCSKSLANILVVYIPWAFSWAFYQGNAIADLLSWGGVLFSSAIAFILPLMLALYMLIKSENPGTVNVYCGLIQSRYAKTISVCGLLVMALLSVGYAMKGLL